MLSEAADASRVHEDGDPLEGMGAVIWMALAFSLLAVVLAALVVLAR